LISPLKLYTDADYANNILTSYSYYGYISMLGDSLISWKSKKYPSVSSSTTQAEYNGLYEAGREAVWLVRLLNILIFLIKDWYQSCATIRPQLI
jgi:hypothetical protein